MNASFLYYLNYTIDNSYSSVTLEEIHIKIFRYNRVAYYYSFFYCLLENLSR
jgi:hypothetical protein